MKRETHQVAIVGAGPAGLGAALELKRLGVSDVVVIERDEAAGGMPRFCDHPGFGLMDVRMMHTGPGYARRYAGRARDAGVDVRTSATVTGWNGPKTLALTGPGGLAEIEAKAILLATGCRERPRAAQLIPGDRPAGVFTTGSLQQFIHGLHHKVGQRAVVVGAEIVGLSALLTLAQAGVKVVKVVTEFPHHQVYWPFVPAKWLLADIWARTQIATSSRLSRIDGGARVEAVEITHSSGQTELVECDTVVFTGNWMPQNELARTLGIALDAGTKGPRVDTLLRTSKPGVFAAGNLLRGAETADTAALEGRYVAGSIQAFVGGATWPAAMLAIEAADPILWVEPNAVSPASAGAPLGRMSLRVKAEQRNAVVEVRQGERLLHEQRFGRLRPNMSESLSAAWLPKVDASGGPLRIALR